MSEGIFCKFRCVDRNLLDSLFRGYIYFASSEQLNDPFDSRIRIVKSLDSAINKSKGKVKGKLQKLRASQKQLDALNAKLSKVGIYSCTHNLHSRSLRQPLLWSHYADKHRGICLIYNIPEEYILGQAMAAVPMDYELNPLTNYFIKWAKSSRKLTMHEFIDELAKRYLSIKDKCWSYEDEYRLVKESPGEFQMEKSYLKYVCFGLNSSKNDRNLVENVLTKGGYKIEFLEMERTKNDFGFRERKI
jgi:hypothetical protein